MDSFKDFVSLDESRDLPSKREIVELQKRVESRIVGKMSVEIGDRQYEMIKDIVAEEVKKLRLDEKYPGTDFDPDMDIPITKVGINAW